MQSEQTTSNAQTKTVTVEAPKRDRKEFVQEVLKLPGGENVLECIQCGLCAGSCPTRFAMDYSPIQIVKMITLGMREEVLSSSTIWECTACHTCAARCPRAVDFTTLMMSLRNLSMKEKVAKNKVKPKFHKGFYDVVNKYGRLHEPSLLLKTMNKTDPKALLHNASLGVRLVRKGKIRLRPQKIEHAADLSGMLKTAKGEKKQ